LRIGVLTAVATRPAQRGHPASAKWPCATDTKSSASPTAGGLATRYAGRPLSRATSRRHRPGRNAARTARYNLDSPTGGRERVLAAIDEHLDALISIGGDGTHDFDVAGRSRGAHRRVPKTLDNDLLGTDYCIGFDTAISIVCESIAGSTRRRRRITASWSSRRWDA